MMKNNMIYVKLCIMTNQHTQYILCVVFNAVYIIIIIIYNYTTTRKNGKKDNVELCTCIIQNKIMNVTNHHNHVTWQLACSLLCLS